MKAQTKGPEYLNAKINPSTITFENQNDVQATLEKLFSCKFRFMSNGIINVDGTFFRGLIVPEYYKIVHPEIPTQDIVVVPHAFYGSYRNMDLFTTPRTGVTYDDDIPLESKEGETTVSIWVKEHPEPKPKRILRYDGPPKKTLPLPSLRQDPHRG